LRAPTPSAAAELVVCTREQVLESIAGCRRILEQHIRYRLSMAARRLHERGVDRATTVVHRSIGRGFQRVDEMERCAADTFRRMLRTDRTIWQGLDMRVRRMDLRLRLAEARRRHAFATEGLRVVGRRLETARARLDSLTTQLNHLSPLQVLDRGYAIVQDSSGHVVKDAGETAAGEELRVRLAKGSLTVEVR
jgi:exodeoxyribonuclease VII large subunit